jgi:hypothetical protein
VEKEALDVLQKVMKYNIHKIGRVIVTSNEVRARYHSAMQRRCQTTHGYL